MPLTDTAIRRAAPKKKPYKMFDSGGLFLLLMPNGGKWWRFKYRFAGKEKLLSLGTGFAYWYMDRPLSWNYLYAGLCLVGAAFFIFRDVA